MDELSTVDSDTLFKRSQVTREDATAFLRDYRLLEHFAQYGDVRLGGAYRWDVMLAPDIDLYVINPDLTLDLALDAFTESVRRGEFLWFAFAESVRAKPAWEVPRGYFLGMTTSSVARSSDADHQRCSTMTSRSPGVQRGKTLSRGTDTP